MKTLVILNKEVVKRIEEMIYESLGYFDEYTYADILFVIEYALGMKKNYTPEEYMYDIFAELGIVKGSICDDELVEYLINSHIEHADDDEMVLRDLNKYLGGC